MMQLFLSTWINSLIALATKITTFEYAAKYSATARSTVEWKHVAIIAEF